MVITPSTLVINLILALLLFLDINVGDIDVGDIDIGVVFLLFWCFWILILVFFGDFRRFLGTHRAAWQPMPMFFFGVGWIGR